MCKRIFTILALALLYVAPSFAQAELAKPKSILTLSFIRYLGWSQTAREGDFVIGVIKDKEISANLSQQSAGKKFGLQDVVVKNFKSIDEVTDCQVLYVSHNVSFARNASTLLDKVGKDTLIITEEEGATKGGSMINFVVRDDRLRFEISKSNAAVANIQIGQKLTDMSAAINL